MKLKRTVVYLSARQRAFMEDHGRLRDISLSEMVRRIIDALMPEPTRDQASHAQSSER
jgi:hypothetical protein